MSYLERAINDGHAQLAGEGKQQKITYLASRGFKTRAIPVKGFASSTTKRPPGLICRP